MCDFVWDCVNDRQKSRWSCDWCRLGSVWNFVSWKHRSLLRSVDVWHGRASLNDWSAKLVVVVFLSKGIHVKRLGNPVLVLVFQKMWIVIRHSWAVFDCCARAWVNTYPTARNTANNAGKALCGRHLLDLLDRNGSCDTRIWASAEICIQHQDPWR